ncbi:hypothetical protein Bbelb_006720 [Branchiostoma belcheri]|nr:hypothetical protein Bbelb_006720 [Branchiostoma belcheri]
MTDISRGLSQQNGDRSHCYERTTAGAVRSADVPNRACSARVTWVDLAGRRHLKPRAHSRLTKHDQKSLRKRLIFTGWGSGQVEVLTWAYFDVLALPGNCDSTSYLNNSLLALEENGHRPAFTSIDTWIESLDQDGVPMLMLEGHYDRNGTLNHLPELPALNVLTLSGGNIRDIRNGTFETLASLRQLSMNGNSLRVVGTWFEGLEAMVRLSLFQNKIESIKRGAFLPLKKLKFLDMSYNRIRSIQAWFFEGLSGLLDLKLNKNKISHIAADVVFYLGLVGDIKLSDNMLQTINPQWFQNLPPRANVYLDNNLLPTNPFRCTCALTSFKTEGKVDNLYCSYPPHLAGKKISEVSLEDMPCPPPVAQVSRADNGTTLLCEVYWEQRPDISWVGPAGSNITNTSGNGITTHLEHAVTHTGHSISFWTNGSSQHTEGSTFNYMGKSTYKLTMSRKALQAWAEDACRCVITYQVDSFSAMTLELVLSLSNSTAKDFSSDSPMNETTTETMPVEYFLLPPNQDSCTLDLVYTGVTSVSVSFLVGLLVGWWLIRPKSSEQPSNPSSRRSSQESLHHYEVIPDSDAVASLPPSDKNLKKRKRWSKHTEIFDNPQYGPGNVKPRRSKRTDVFVNPQYGPGTLKQYCSKHTKGFVNVNPQYGQHCSKHTDVFVNPQYGPGNVKQHRSKHTKDFVINPQYGQHCSKHTEVFVNPQYGPGNVHVKQHWSKHTEVYYSPQYGQAKGRRRWSTPVLVAYNDGIVPPSAERMACNNCRK